MLANPHAQMALCIPGCAEFGNGAMAKQCDQKTKIDALTRAWEQFEKCADIVGRPRHLPHKVEAPQPPQTGTAFTTE